MWMDVVDGWMDGCESVECGVDAEGEQNSSKGSIDRPSCLNPKLKPHALNPIHPKLKTLIL